MYAHQDRVHICQWVATESSLETVFRCTHPICRDRHRSYYELVVGISVSACLKTEIGCVFFETDRQHGHG